MSEQLNKEAKTGTLEHLYTSSLNPVYILLARVFSTFFYISVSSPVAFYLLQLSTGVYVNLKFLSILPILVLTFIGLCGFGFILAGITLIFKRIGVASLILPFFPFGLVVLPLENLSGNLQTLVLLLPLAYGAKLIRLVALQNQGFIALVINGNILILLLNSLFYLSLGMFGYKILEKIAKEKGLLAHY
jgi:ABC-2 type transport system permease protein